MSLFTVVTRNNNYQLPQTKLIVGLGNDGEEYSKTRHNAGFMAVDSIRNRADLPQWSKKTNFSCYLSEGQIEDTKVIIAKPTTLMNRSGQAVLMLQNYFELGIDQILIIHDEIDLPFGTIKTKLGGGSAGHNGVKSVEQTIGEDFARIRIGVADENRDKTDASDYVLKNFPKKQLDKLPEIFEITDKLAMNFIDETFETTKLQIYRIRFRI